MPSRPLQLPSSAVRLPLILTEERERERTMT
ncbi:unnamed protein product [Spirodela intermedia]|uniref:Uncharacterized protein n=1 Tax=Spirodela intermedia TaxID=51605 RepID=A0A7I8KU79_SPIIN|nr:unnamed protein product [Spirodela intermedia]